MTSIYLDALWSVILPLLLLVVPGVAMPVKDKNSSTGVVARIILWSVTISTLSSLVVVALHWPVWITIWPLMAVSMVGLWWRRSLFVRAKNRIKIGLWIIALVGIFAIMSVPFLLIHQGLPSGDSQKSIIWAKDVIDKRHLPDYTMSFSLLNRDPVDFYTPALHTLTAMLMSLSIMPLLVVGFFSLVMVVGVTAIAIAIVRLLFPELPGLPIIITTAWLVLSNYRFLRYVREPGYHLQNVVGELLLFGLLFLALSLFKRWRWSDLTLALLLLLTLSLCHQFSAFIAAFVLVAVGLVWLISQFMRQHFSWRQLRYQLIAPLLLIMAVASVAIYFGLGRKVADIFTTHPHLQSLLIPFAQYPQFLGALWLFAGLAGFIWITTQGCLYWRQKPELIAFSIAMCVIFILSQAPLFGVDIPPTRALLYGVVPLSIASAGLIVFWWEKINTQQSRIFRVWALLLLSALIIGSGIQSIWSAFQLNHQAPTNSTLTAGERYLSSALEQTKRRGAVLTDDYNRRSTSWLVLSGRPMFTRLGTDLTRQMAESKQSSLRNQLYLNQLDYEKIYSLGNLSLINSLLDKQNIGFLTGIKGSTDDVFSHNPSLTVVAQADNINLYGRQSQRGAGLGLFLKPGVEQWLLRDSTLANVIGDDEDTFQHLPASLRAPRLSGPQFDGQHTYRTTTAAEIPLLFNVGDFSRLLWDAKGLGYASSPLQLLVTFASTTPGLHVRTETGHDFVLPTDGTPLLIPATDLPFGDNGLVQLVIENPQESPVSLSLIALGLASTK